MNDTTTVAAGGLATDETDRLISSDKVEGTPVYNPKGERLGKVHHLMIDKYTGQVAYAVMSFGGFLGKCSPTTPVWAAMLWTSTATSSKKRRAMPRLSHRIGPTGHTLIASTS